MTDYTERVNRCAETNTCSRRFHDIARIVEV